MDRSRARLAGSAGVTAALTLVLLVPAGPVSAAERGPAPVSAARHARYEQTNLVADTPGRAQITDPHLVNPWGASFGPGSPLWVSDNGTNVTTLYSGGVHGGRQTTVPLVVTLPGGVPTGQVYNPTSDFVIRGSDGSSAPALFLFVGLSGHLTGWNPAVPSPAPSVHAQDAVVTPGAVDTGLAIGSLNGHSRLFAADFSAGTVDVYDGTFRRVITAGNFADRKLPQGYAPFNVAVLNGKVYVTYAKRGRNGLDVAGAGLGRIDVFTLGGKLVRRLNATAQLDAPWGLTIAPRGFGTFSGDLLVGNFGDGRIHAFDARTLAPRGVLTGEHGHAISINGLWDLIPGNGTEAATNEVIFTAGPDRGRHGLLGTLRAHG